jgi:hypothetical protein
MKLWVQVILLSLFLGCAGKAKEETNVAANSKDHPLGKTKKSSGTICWTSLMEEETFA